jgi:hypothetical protein
MSNPPASKRYCTVCESIQTFNYQQNIGHSACSKCGCRFAIKIDDNAPFAKVWQKYQNEIASNRGLQQKLYATQSQFNRFISLEDELKKIIRMANEAKKETLEMHINIIINIMKKIKDKDDKINRS